ncbi:hypothetical protein ColLi_07714 [Colletotrichum liriopes]|uniref:Uncharacterized protein n=1 Tax=Colletotrichum liriopes TaxID=708192 RepID=A0AA37GR30_9PEZI|nr:hypothetical protein ColLi_07714 [Colletotrichum liriopes]
MHHKILPTLCVYREIHLNLLQTHQKSKHNALNGRVLPTPTPDRLLALPTPPNVAAQLTFALAAIRPPSL